MKYWNMFIIAVILMIVWILILGCQTQKQWSKKGFDRGWMDTTTIKIYDTIHFVGSSKDTLFYGSVDTLFLKDRNFTTTYFRDSITHKIYLKTIVNNRDTTVIKEIHTTNLKEVQYTFIDHLKAVWQVWFGLFVLFIIIALITILRK